MSFDIAAGTRGARQPSGFVLRAVNNMMAGRIRRKGGKVMGFNALILTKVGGKTGAERTNPVGWFPRFARYQQKTDRELPIIRLVPQTSGQAPQE